MVLKDNKGGLEMNRRIKVYESNIDGVDDVCWIRIGGRQYFISGLGTDKQNITLGLFDRLSDAADAYDSAAYSVHGEYAWLNCDQS